MAGQCMSVCLCFHGWSVYVCVSVFPWLVSVCLCVCVSMAGQCMSVCLCFHGWSVYVCVSMAGQCMSVCCLSAGEVAAERGADGEQPGMLRQGLLLHAAAEACRLDPD